MAAVPKIVARDTSPAPDTARMNALRTAVADFDRDQLLWSSGFLAGLAQRPAHHFDSENPVPRLAEQAVHTISEETWTVFFATETGNSRRLAQKLVAESVQTGLAFKLQDIREFRPKDLQRVDNALFIVATHGIGDAPDGTEAFFEFWASERAPRLENLAYSVLSLGDSSYADFCETGRLLDERLASLGAKRLADRVDCDLDFDQPARAWTGRIVARAKELAKSTGQLAEKQQVSLRSIVNSAVTTAPAATRDRPFDARL
ncbi:MAG: flavodoxin domain-containing protein, partial [Woeseiaceae bacterium]